ncbi:flagellar export chaperone FliS [Propionivibrio soli]|uniref:flagellar export chaperone FliS n=1 Tax=Propionivibrio soli TaxID=2976531 RepID=UPI0021E929E6|nr:flagellar export chaperone FliS [Propionivibrio soli]
MFGSSTSPVNAYNKVSLETSVANASPHQLIVLLFEGARQAIIIARAGIEAGDTPRKGTAITKAIDIILNGLRASLNLEEGGNIAQNLYALYDYMARRLLHANLTNDKAALDEVLKLLSEIHEAWVAIGDKVNNGTAN